MRRMFVALVAAGMVSGAAHGADLRLTNSQVLTMDSGPTYEVRDIVVRDGKFTSSDASEDAETIDLGGMYVVPGLAEMHAHVPVPRMDSPGYREDVLFLWVANGVTPRPRHDGSSVASRTARRDCRARRPGPSADDLRAVLQRRQRARRCRCGTTRPRSESSRVRLPENTPRSLRGRFRSRGADRERGRHRVRRTRHGCSGATRQPGGQATDDRPPRRIRRGRWWHRGASPTGRHRGSERTW